MTPLGLAKKISKALRILGYGTSISGLGAHGPLGPIRGVHVWKKLPRGGEDPLGLVTIDTRNGEP